MINWLRRRLRQEQPDELTVPDLSRRCEFTFEPVELPGSELVQWGYTEGGLVNSLYRRLDGIELYETDVRNSNIDFGHCDLLHQHELLGDSEPVLHAGKREYSGFVLDTWESASGRRWVARSFQGAVLVEVVVTGLSVDEVGSVLRSLS